MSKWTRRKKNKENRVWGVERDPGSELHGEQVLEHIYLWAKPGGLTTRNNYISGVLPHGRNVNIKKRKTYRGVRYYYVTGQRAGIEVPEGWREHLTVPEDKQMVQSGWITETLLENAPAH